MVNTDIDPTLIYGQVVNSIVLRHKQSKLSKVWLTSLKPFLFDVACSLILTVMFNFVRPLICWVGSLRCDLASAFGSLRSETQKYAPQPLNLIRDPVLCVNK